jgi:hypothetical protein
MEYDIPLGQWFILLLCVIITGINFFFENHKKPIEKKSYENENQLIKYNSYAEIYEDKVDYILK